MNPLLHALGILCKRLTNRYATVSAMLLVLLLPEFTFATHISGADLTYRWVSGNTYELTLALYRDCSGISAPTNVTITYSSVTCGVNSTVTINKKPGTGNEISMVCSTAVTTCSGGTYPGFQKWEYVGNVTLPNQCPDWVFGYSICCRNCAITTLSYTPNNCTGVPATYIEATLNNLVVPNNSAPSFTNIPVLFFCIGQTIHFNHGAYDSDGDSLVYSWITPRSAAGTNVVFKPGYSASSPLSSSPAITLDNSGDITISPTALEVGVMAILVKEYRNGVLVGSVVRDMEVWTQSCSNIFPAATGANGTTSYDMVACPGKPFSFYVNSSDPNSGQTVTMTYNGNIPGATFTTSAPPYPQGVFSWTPTIGQARSQPYSFLVTVQDNNCPMNGFQTYSYTVLVPPLSATTSGVNATCAVPTNGSVSVTATGSAPFTYLWTPTSSTGSTISGIGSGTYTVTVTDKYGCTTTATRAITQPTPVSVVVTPTATTCGLANGTAVASASGGTGPYSYNWLPDHQTNSSHTGMAAGNYSVIITDANGCTTSAATTVTANTPPAITIASSSNVSCYAGNNGSASALVSGGQSPFTYNWSPSGGAMASASSLSAGSYSVQVTDANGCTSVASVTISQPTALSATPSVHDGTCAVNNGSASVSVSGGTSPYSYLWTPGSSTSSSISSLSSGAYSVRVTDAHGCSSTISMSVGNSGIMSGLAISTTSVSCHGGNDAGANISFTGGTPPYTYSWTPGGSTTSSVTGLHSGNYTCVVTDAYGCTQSASATITEPAAILLSTASSTNASCSGMNDGSAIATASGGTTPYTFIWQGYPVNGPVMNNIFAGSYNVVVTDANGCQTNSVAVISEPTSLSLLSNVTPATCGSSNGSAHVQVSGGTPPYSYSWNNGQTTSTATGLAAGSYDVTVTDSHNCTLQVSVGVSNLNGPSANLSFSTDARCFGSADGSAGVTVSGGTPPFTYQWSSGGSITSTAYNLSAGSHTVVITDANNCVTTVPVQISQPAVIAPQLSASDVSCYNGSNGQISLTVNGGTPPYSYLWSNSALTSSIVNLQAGNYSVQITDANGCTSSLATAVNQPGALSVALSASDVRCSGGNDGFVSVSASGGTQPYSFLWPSSGTTASLDNGLPAGSYSVVITDANGCTLTGTTTVHEPLPLTLSSSVIDGTCGAANGTGNIIAGGGTAPYSYYWSFNGSTASSQNALAQGVYNVLVTDDYGCTNSIDITVGNSGSMTATVASVSSVSCHSGANASAAISLSGGTPPFNYSWTPGNFSAPVVSGLTAGNYTCIVTDAHSCTQSVSVYIDEPQELVAASTVVTPIRCFGNTDGVVSVNASGGVSPYSYAWSQNSNSAQSITSLGAGTYSVVVTDANGCTATAEAQLTEPSILTLSTNSTPAQCGASDGIVSASTGGGTLPYSYMWLPGNGTASTMNGVQAGSYTVTVTDANQCTISASVGVSNSNGPQAQLVTSHDVSCFGGEDGSAEIQVNSGVPPYTVLWSSGVAAGMQVSGLDAGQHTATVSDFYGCISAVTFNIAQPTRLAISVTTENVSCNGGNNGSAQVISNGGVAPYFYQWTSGSLSDTAQNLTAGNYLITVTDNNACETEADVTISEPTAINLTSTPFAVNCAGGSDGYAIVQGTGGTGLLNYNWSDGQSSATANALAAGIYIVTATDANGCTATSTAVVNEPTAIQVTSLVNSISCYGGNNGSVLLNVLGGVEPYHYNWSPQGGADASAMNLPAGNYTTLVTDNHGCTFTTQNIISEPPAINASAIVSAVSCYDGSDGSLRTNVSGGTPPYQYVWGVSNAEGESAFGLTAGSYSVTISDQNGCTVSTGGVISQPTQVQLTAIQPPAICIGQTATLNAQASGGTLPYTYQWSNGGSNQQMQVNPNVTTSYSVTAIDANGCASAPVQLMVGVNPPLQISSVAGDTICVGSTGVLHVVAEGGNGGPFDFMWSEGSTGNTINVSPGVNTLYTVTVNDHCGTPPVTQQVMLVVNPIPFAGFTPQPPVGCSGMTVQFYPSPNSVQIASSSWNFGDGSVMDGQSVEHTYSYPGTYNVQHTVISTDGCRADATMPASVVVNPKPLADFSASNTEVSVFNPVVDFVNLSSGAIGGIWNFGDNSTSLEMNPQHTFPDTGYYEITLIVNSDKMCYDTIRKSIYVRDEFAIYFPNTFTPNNDGVNETFKPFGVGVADFEMTIFDRWGLEIYRTNNIDRGWDGAFRIDGKLCQADTYVYKSVVTDSGGRKHSYIGAVNLVR